MATYDLVIIGGGPGGISASIYAQRAGMKTVLVEKMGIGGQIALSDIIENYPGFPSLSGGELMHHFEEHARSLDIEIKYANIEKISKEGDTFTLTVGGGDDMTCKAIILATGAQPAKLGIPGEDEFTGRGVSTCATCDGPFYRQKEVVVVGGGDTAVKESIFLSKLTSKIHHVHRRDEFRAEKVLQDRIAEKENIEFHWFHEAVEILGDQSGVTGVKVKDTRSGKEKTIEVPGVFLFVGVRPQTSLVECEKDGGGFIITDENMESSVRGLFAIGDCRVTPLRQVATAVGDGAIAATKAEEYVSELEGRLYAGKKDSRQKAGS